MKKKLLSAAVGLALSTSAAFAVPVDINPDAAGVDPTITVGALDWAPGNTLAQGGNIAAGGALVGQSFQVYSQALLNAFTDVNGTGIGGLNLNGPTGATNYEWTFVAGFRETVTSVSGNTAQFAVSGGPENFFRIYYDPNKNASNLAGTGFNDGILILSGTIVAGTGNFSRTGGGPGTSLDNFGTDNYPNIDSVVGNGGSVIRVQVNSFDSNFFTSGVSLIDLDFTTQQVLNFGQTDPSALFTNAANSATVPGATVANIGTCNGCTAAEGGTANVMFQSDANSSFTTAVPEPGSLALLGLGFAALGLSGIRRSKKISSLV